MATSLELQYIDESYQKLVQVSGSNLSDGAGNDINNLTLTASYATTASYAENGGTWDGQYSGSAGITGSLTFKATTIPPYPDLVIQGADGFTGASITGVDSMDVEQLGFTKLSGSQGGHLVDSATTGLRIGRTKDTTGNLIALGFPTIYTGTDGYNFILTSQSLNITVPILGNVTGSLEGTASYAKSVLGVNVTGSVANADNSVSSSYAVSATSSSFANTSISSSYATTADTSISSSFALSASYADTSLFASTASFLLGTIESASYAINSTSASYADTAAFATDALDAVTAQAAISASHALVADTALTTITSQYSDNTIVYGKNLSGAEIPKGTPLYFTGSGTEGNLVGVYPADASNPLRMPAAGIAGETLAIQAEGAVLLDGFINEVNTTGFQAGQEVYVAVGGGYTNIRPTGSSVLVQTLGYIEKVGVNGSGVIKGPGHHWDLPNIQEGYLWVGGTGDVPTIISSESLSPATASYALNAATASHLLGSITSASFAITASHALNAGEWDGQYNGNAGITGSLTVNGNTSTFGVPFAKFNAPSAGTQLDFYDLDNVSFTNGVNMTNSSTTMQNYGNDFSSYKNALVYEFWDSFGYNYGADMSISPVRTGMSVVPSGSSYSQQAFMELKQQWNGTSFLNAAAPTMTFGSTNGFPNTTDIDLNTINGNIGIDSGGILMSAGGSNLSLSSAGFLGLTSAGAMPLQSSYFQFSGGTINQITTGSSSNVFAQKIEAQGGLEITGPFSLGQQTIGAGDVTANTASLDFDQAKQGWVNQVPGTVYIDFINSGNGKFMDVLLFQSATGSNFIFDSGISWIGGSAPSIPVSNFRADLIRVNSFYNGDVRAEYVGTY